MNAADAQDFLTGVKRADMNIPYVAILPNSVGFDGQTYNCECVAVSQDKRRISNGDLDIYNITIVECIEASNATAAQTADMVNLWTTCVDMHEAGMLTYGWWIGCIILGIVAVVEFIIILFLCITWSYRKNRVY
jgi:hypothetical protein